MEWTTDEDKTCCKACIDEYVIQKYNTKIGNFIYWIKQNPCMKSKGEGTIRCKIQNIKSLLDRWNVRNTIPIAGRGNASKQNIQQLKLCLEEAGIEYLCNE